MTEHASPIDVFLENFLTIVIGLWPLWVAIGVIALARAAYSLYRWRRLSRSGIHEIDKMDGKTFERYLETLFTRLGYAVERTRYVGDYGADLVVKRDGTKTVVQAKRSSRKVGIAAVQQVVAAKAQYGCERAMVVTNDYYTVQALKLAKSNKVTTWDRDRLVSALLSAKGISNEADDQVPGNIAFSREGNEASTASAGAATCAKCASPVSAKVMDFCLSRPERFKGLVYCYDHQRGRR